MVSLYKKTNTVYFVAGTFALFTLGVSFVYYHTGFLSLPDFLNVVIASSSVLSILVAILTCKVINMNKKIKAQKAQKQPEIANVDRTLEEKICSIESESLQTTQELVATRKQLNDANNKIYNTSCELEETQKTRKENDIEYKQYMDMFCEQVFEMEELQRELNKVTERVNSERKKNKILEEKIYSVKSKSLQKTQELVATRKQLNDANAEIHSASCKIKEIQKISEENDIERKKYIDMFLEQRCKMEELQEELNKITEHVNSERKKNKILEEKICNIESESFQKTQELVAVRKQLNDANDKIFDILYELKGINEESDIECKKHRAELLRQQHCERSKLQDELDEVKKHTIQQMENFKCEIITLLIDATGEFIGYHADEEHSEEEILAGVQMIKSHLMEKFSTYSICEKKKLLALPANDMTEVSFVHGSTTFSVLPQKRG